MDEVRVAMRKALADARRDGGGEVSDLLRDVEESPRPPAEPRQFDDLVRRAKAGDPRAREAVIESLLPLVSSLAREHRTAGLEHADLVQEGCVGILRALTRFDPDRGVPFPAYAAPWVRHALQELRSHFVRPLRLPPKALRQLAQLRREHSRIYAEEHRNARAAELATSTGLDLDHVEALLRTDASMGRLDEPLRGLEGEIGTLGDLLEDPLSNDQYEEVLDTIAGRQLRALLAHLTDREHEIVNSRFGFGRPAEKLEAIGARLGISAERVRQLEERALSKLRLSSQLDRSGTPPRRSK
jgi:RNA polymerase sigma factor (sigma-70 family)